MTELSSTEQSMQEEASLVIAEVQSRAQGVVDRKLKSSRIKQKIVHTLVTLALPFMSAACNSFPSIVNLSNPFVESSEMKAQRNELLNEEQLKEANIGIVQTPGVKLSLKRSVFDFEVFKDASKGRLKELVVVLVDDSSLSWNAGKKLPKDIQEVYQTSLVNPYERSAKEWTQELNPEELKRAMTSEAEHISTLGTIIRFDGEFNDGPSTDLIDFMEKRSSPGEVKRLERKIVASRDPKLKDKVFIFVAVGGKRKPYPNQSYLSPNQFQEIPGSHPPGYTEGTYRYIGPTTAGQTLRHESEHYYNNPHGISSSEYNADTGMFKSIEDAWKRKQEGDESGYPFVFETAEGVTITKNIAQQDPSNPAA